MYKYAVSFTDQAQNTIWNTTLQAKNNNTNNAIQIATNGTGEVYASNLKEARVNANEKFLDKTIESVMQERGVGAFYA
ncbi:hypothetical protein [Acetobacter lovaniensis]|uniref:Uncharacterized protein n=2 Tax=Acetobacter TaxID=434 RepID=A0A841QFH1_9PROT|nr:hypothetical protein [Acetobacter lovaniensis]MBB6456812.1 hypothetical protein [Acetobacter lovaniensis]NHN81190.1 hypothetical protein [Acetobacter lovaniensis]GBQ70190.1 hypothetical protein AA0474_2132 [Acetobacter lovaniensis NRIC 0474]